MPPTASHISRGRLFSVCFVSLLIASSHAAAQVSHIIVGLRNDTVHVLSQEAPRSTTTPSKSTTLAVGLSAVLPGSGQIYVERYWTIPVIWGFGIHFANQWKKADGLYRNARDRYASSVQRGENAGRGDGQARLERDFYRDERDRFAFYIAITYLLNLVDAYVGASLYNFDVSEDLGGNARLQVRIPIRN
jgi:hypothetical protein